MMSKNINVTSKMNDWKDDRTVLKLQSRRRCGRAFKGANEPAASPEGKVVGSSPGLRQTQSKLVVRKISAIRARVSNG